jgi:MoxR-like ATPase
MNVVELFQSQPQVQLVVSKFFAESIALSHAISAVGWVAYEKNRSIVLCIRNVYTVRFLKDLSGKSIEGLCVMVATAMLTPELKRALEEWNCLIDGGLKNTGPGGSEQVIVPYSNPAHFALALERVRPAHEKFITNVLTAGSKTNWPKKYDPTVVEYLREAIRNPALPHPSYFNHPSPPPQKLETRMSIISQIHNYIESRKYYFNPRQIACFYTALQTKGFVILSGISGTGKTKLAQLFAEMLPAPSKALACPNDSLDDTPDKNSLFISVRPDWRDGKSLLGYYNPLTRTYEWTPFLRFVQRAVADYKKEKQCAWFVILDEMNLARVEYYFADLLSVLESGRDENGYTREPLRLQFPDESGSAQMPPAELHLPPNLYFIGTVNVDETTHAFSPKVLDRAFSMEFLGVDFERYIELTEQPTSGRERFSPEQGREILESFTRKGEFARVEKGVISSFVQADQSSALALQELNTALQPYNLHFGYRVFDEIMMFLHNAGAVSDALDPVSAFDQAVLMKILPKFHGSRGKLEQPLNLFLEWCASSAHKTDVAKVARANPAAPFRAEDWCRPETARRVLRMFQALDSIGFASFG